MSRYEWLEVEIETIRTRRFHVIEALEGRDLLPTLNDQMLPDEYKDFVRLFGRAKLYRQGSSYRVGVVAPLEEAQSPSGESLLRIGHFDEARAYYKLSDLTAGGEAPIFEWGRGELQRAGDGFDDWLTRRCAAARKKYGTQRWKEILAGPEPFSIRELSIIDAWRKFRWRVLGVTEGKDLRLEVHNGSDLYLPYLSIGVKGLDGNFEGRIWLPVSHVAPGTTAVLEKDCYKRNVEPSQVQLFSLPDPEPEDRERYWEFRDLK